MSNTYDTPPFITEHGEQVIAVRAQLWDSLRAEHNAAELPKDPADEAAYMLSVANAIAENPRDIFGPPPHELDDYRDIFMDPSTRVIGFVNEAGVVVGAVTLIPNDEGEPNKAHVLGLFRLKAVDGEGYGSRLMLAALELALELGQDHVTIDVARSNRAVVQFYADLGFRLFFISDHAVSMELRHPAAIEQACIILRHRPFKSLTPVIY